MSDVEILEYIYEKSLLKVSEEHIYHWMDIAWVFLRTSLPKLLNIALFWQTIPHNNAAVECFFSMIAKNKTKFRSNLDSKKSLNSNILIKLNRPNLSSHAINGNFQMIY